MQSFICYLVILTYIYLPTVFSEPEYSVAEAAFYSCFNSFHNI